MLYTARVLNSPFGKYEEKRPPLPPSSNPNNNTPPKHQKLVSDALGT